DLTIHLSGLGPNFGVRGAARRRRYPALSLSTDPAQNWLARPEERRKTVNLARCRTGLVQAICCEAAPMTKSAQDVGDGVAAGGFAGEELCGANSTVSEEVAIRGAVGELDALAVAEQVDGVIADHVAATHAEHGDFFVGTR